MATVDPTCPKVLNMLVLDSDGRRLGVKYFSPEWYARQGGGGGGCAAAVPSIQAQVVRLQTHNPALQFSSLHLQGISQQPGKL